jgi:hypothetical protein
MREGWKTELEWRRGRIVIGKVSETVRSVDGKVLAQAASTLIGTACDGAGMTRR